MSESARILASGKFGHMASAHELERSCTRRGAQAVRSAHPGPTPALFSTKKSTAARSRASSPKSTTAFILLKETMTAAAGDVTNARERCASPSVLARGLQQLQLRGTVRARTHSCRTPCAWRRTPRWHCCMGRPRHRCHLTAATGFTRHHIARSSVSYFNTCVHPWPSWPDDPCREPWMALWKGK